MMMKMTMTGLCRLCILLMHLFGKLLVRPWPDQPDRVLRLCNTVIGTLAVGRWSVTFGTARRGLGRLWPRPVSSSLY